MSNIEKIDKNFAVKSVNSAGTVFYDCMDEPFRVYGLIQPQDGGVFLRMPEDVAARVSSGVAALNRHTAGGRVRFRTNSPYVMIKAEVYDICRMPHFALCGSAGFDLYVNENGVERHAGTFQPPYDVTGGFESKAVIGKTEERDVTVNFPLYSSVKTLKIGLKEGSTLNAADDYQHTVPVVYYGSSITQGGCASRPGNSYENIISRDLDCDYINLGFSGSARGEEAMAEYIAGLSMSVFVYDYDYNAPTPEHLEQTHGRMFSIIRGKNPLLPIIMVSCPTPYMTESQKRRRDIIKATYDRAVAAGDQNVYFIDGSEILSLFGGDSGTVDNCHPNDLGFMCMAKVIGAKVAEIFK